MIGLTRIRGQDRALELLRKALESERVPHAYLFAGPSGVGKGTTAIALAAALNCEREPGRGCGACGPCAKIADGTHPDVCVLRPSGAGNFIVVDDIRTLTARLSFAPHEGRARVVVVEDAERLKPEAANAFLKTLEEPPARTHFVLCTSSPEQLLVTVQSRCQKVRFGALEDEAVVAILGAAGVTAERARAAATLANGSAARAAELAAGDALERRRERAFRLLGAVGGRGFRTVTEAAAELAQEKDDLVPALEMVAHFYRDAAALAAGVAPETLMNRDRVAELRAEAARAGGPAPLARQAAAVLDTQVAILGFASPQLALERLILTLRVGIPWQTR